MNAWPSSRVRNLLGNLETLFNEDALGTWQRKTVDEARLALMTLLDERTQRAKETMAAQQAEAGTGPDRTDTYRASTDTAPDRSDRAY